jgi:hypothetical protein
MFSRERKYYEVQHEKERINGQEYVEGSLSLRIVKQGAKVRVERRMRYSTLAQHAGMPA